MKKILFCLMCVLLVAFNFASCEKDKDEDSQSEPCGGDSCLVSTCKNHPATDWVWEHCYDYAMTPTGILSGRKPKFYYRENLTQMNNCEWSYNTVYGGYNERIIHEYDIWNRK